jgi:hypothetical protein
MSENPQVPAAQNPAENPSKANLSDPNWQTDLDAWNGIQYILYLMSGVQQTDAIQHELDSIGNCTRIMSYAVDFCGPYLGLTPSDAAKLIASIAKPLLALYKDATFASYDQYLQDKLGGIIDMCKDIDPSSAS